MIVSLIALIFISGCSAAEIRKMTLNRNCSLLISVDTCYRAKLRMLVLNLLRCVIHSGYK